MRPAWTDMDGSLHGTLPPIVDLAVLAQLGAGIDRAVYEGFIRDYIGMLPRRLARLERVVQAMDYEEAMDAVLSLKSSSLMVGASRLAAIASDLETKLKMSAPRTGQDSPPSFPDLQAQMASIRGCMAATMDSLSLAAQAAGHSKATTSPVGNGTMDQSERGPRKTSPDVPKDTRSAQ